ncbi:MAG: VanZ family protein [Pyrinomonadaceae bacterium]|nr:VanZ family protein [Pyrinomonadaceae bacterium]MCX7639620.1 VanZ family protein [Pyrinomonadaceae bacterium]MDW8303362.1 VanZ family protein [Acidobacteriota bacterium]
MISVSSKWRSRFIRYAPLLLWMVIIFLLSSNLGSMSNTSRFIRPLLEFLFPNASEETLQLYHGYIRKFAHIIEYAILAVLASRAFILSSLNLIRKYWFAVAFILVVIVAIADEINQSFITSRTSSPKDVFIDCVGGLVAILVFYILKNRS